MYNNTIFNTSYWSTILRVYNIDFLNNQAFEDMEGKESFDSKKHLFPEHMPKPINQEKQL